MPGPAPKPAAQRQRRNRTSTAATLEAPGPTKVPLPDVRWSAIKCIFGDGPQRCPLPKWRHTRSYFEQLEAIAEETGSPLIDPHDFEPKAIAWRPTTVQWWDVIWASPMADEWVDADVPGLLALAILQDEFWTAPDSKVHAEIRQACREFGLSPLSRRQLQWEIRRVEASKPPAPPASKPKARGASVFDILQGGKSRRKATG